MTPVGNVDPVVDPKVEKTIQQKKDDASTAVAALKAWCETYQVELEQTRFILPDGVVVQVAGFLEDGEYKFNASGSVVSDLQF